MAMDPIIWEREPPALRSPVLVASFSGWNDAANAASTALGAIGSALETELVARIDPEEFFDFQANRPTIEITEGMMESIEWPDNLLVSAIASESERDLLLISGTEPSMRWRSFCNSVVDVAERCGVEDVVTFGSLIADVAHTRPVPITGLASEPDMADQLGFGDVSYEGPTGVLGVFHAVCRDRGLRTASLWAAIPHYAAAVPNPKAGLALLRRLEGMVGIAIEAEELEQAAKAFEVQVSQAVEANPEIKELVERLEEQQDQVAEFTAEDVPSGDTIAMEFQKFLQERGQD
jgi:predicted ATP-grasp superfamily ATP-dependent carboligase